MQQTPTELTGKYLEIFDTIHLLNIEEKMLNRT